MNAYARLIQKRSRDGALGRILSAAKPFARESRHFRFLSELALRGMKWKPRFHAETCVVKPGFVGGISSRLRVLLDDDTNRISRTENHLLNECDLLTFSEPGTPSWPCAKLPSL
jgi:hypothetical protein